METNQTLKGLSDESLCKILGFLSVRDQLSCAHAAERFRWLLVERIWRQELNRWTAYIELDQEDYNMLFALNGTLMERLVIAENAKELSAFPLTSPLEWYHWDFAVCMKCQFLNLRSMSIYSENLDKFLKGFQLSRHQCPKLECLSLSQNEIVLKFAAPTYSGVCPQNAAFGQRSVFIQRIIEETFRISRSINMPLVELKISSQCELDDEFLALFRMNSWKHLKVLTIHMPNWRSQMMTLLCSIRLRIKALGIFYVKCFLPGDFDTLVPLEFFKELRQLHHTGINEDLWRFLKLCPRLDHIYLYYSTGYLKYVCSRNDGAFIAEDFAAVLYKKNSCRVRPGRSRERAVFIHLHKTMEEYLLQFLDEWAQNAVYRREGAYKFNFIFDVVDEQFTPSVHFYF